MVTTPHEVAEALIGVGVPGERARRIAHAVDRAENASTKEDVEHATALIRSEVRQSRLELQIELGEQIAPFEQRMSMLESRMSLLEGVVIELEKRIAAIEERLTVIEERLTVIEEKVTALGERMAKLEARMTVLEGRMDRLEERMDELAARMDAETARNDQRHRQMMLPVLGIGATLIGMGATGLLRLFEVI